VSFHTQTPHSYPPRIVGQLLPIARKVAADMNVVLNDTELTAEIAAANGSMRDVMNRVKRLARRRQSAT